MDKDKEDKNEEDGDNKYLTYGLIWGPFLGSILAIFLNVFTGNVLVWCFTPGLGFLLGLIVGIIMDANLK